MRRIKIAACLPIVWSSFACGGASSENNDAVDGGAGGIPTATATATEGNSGGSDDGEGGNEQGSDSADGPDSDGADDDDGGEAPKFDTQSPDGQTDVCGGGGDGGGNGGAPLSHIWIANSSQNTLTKLNTETMVEEGRYYVRPDLSGNPSRTSVALSGNAAVASRSGGVSKFFANPEDCVESNGMPGLQTSTGAADIVAWDVEECRAWHLPLTYGSNRPLAWAPGEWNAATCSWQNEMLWTAGAGGGAATAEVLLIDGETGVINATVSIPEVNNGIGIYGGAVDGDGNFWGTESGQRLIRVDRVTQDYTLYPAVQGAPSYGIAVDSKGRPWVCGGGGASRFDEATQTYQTYVGSGTGIGGCMTDGQGTLWHSRYPEGVLVGIDTETVLPVSELVIPAYVHGVSIDFSGNVWGVTFASTSVFRVDPVTGQVDTYDGLVGAYTYSDMTGFALSSAGVPTG